MKIIINKDINGWYQAEINQTTPSIKLSGNSKQTKQEAIESLVYTVDYQISKLNQAVKELKNF
ncbi:MAG: hypothetical protein RIE52_12010 [Balneola sp.]